MARLFLRFTTISLFLGLIVPIGFSSLAYAQNIQFNGPTVGAPGNRESGASRSSPCATSDRGLLALLPETNIGLTTEAHPTFFAYIPPSSANTAEFILYEEASDELIYDTTFQVNGQSGIASVSVPDSAPSLEIGKTYYWYFTVVCDVNDRSGDMVVQGTIQRVAVNSDLARQLASSSPQERPAIYAAAGIWQDALATLATQNHLEPNNSNARSNWNALLTSVGLQDIADEQWLTQN